MVKPVISYPGSKLRFYEHMKNYFPKDMVDFREPFFGGGSVGLSVADDPTFSKLERIQVGDLAPEIWALWEGIRDNPDAVCEICDKWYREKLPHHPQMRAVGMDILKDYIEKEKDYTKDPHINPAEYASIQEKIDITKQAVAEAEAFWAWADSVDTSTLTLEERAARTFLVNKFSFSGMGDSGSLSKERCFAYSPEKLVRIKEASPLLKRMIIKNVSFEETMKDVDPKKSFVFLDPPYYQQGQTGGLYGRHGDTHSGFPHEHFAEFTKALNCKWFVTYDDSVKVRKMFKGKPQFIEEGHTKGKIYFKPFVIPGGYTMAMKNSVDALAGEELFIANYDINQDNIEDLDI